MSSVVCVLPRRNGRRERREVRASHGRALIAMGSEGESAAAVADDAGLAALLASLDDEVERAEGRRTAEEEAAGMERVREEAPPPGECPCCC